MLLLLSPTAPPKGCLEGRCWRLLQLMAHCALRNYAVASVT